MYDRLILLQPGEVHIIQSLAPEAWFDVSDAGRDPRRVITVTPSPPRGFVTAARLSVWAIEKLYWTAYNILVKGNGFYATQGARDPLSRRHEISQIGGAMNELVTQIVKKTGIPEATARTVVTMVIDYLKKKLPAPVAAQIDGVLSSDAAVQQAENLMGDLTSGFGKKKS